MLECRMLALQDIVRIHVTRIITDNIIHNHFGYRLHHQDLINRNLQFRIDSSILDNRFVKLRPLLQSAQFNQPHIIQRIKHIED